MSACRDLSTFFGPHFFFCFTTPAALRLVGGVLVLGVGVGDSVGGGEGDGRGSSEEFTSGATTQFIQSETDKHGPINYKCGNYKSKVYS